MVYLDKMALYFCLYFSGITSLSCSQSMASHTYKIKSTLLDMTYKIPQHVALAYISCLISSQPLPDVSCLQKTFLFLNTAHCFSFQCFCLDHVSEGHAFCRTYHHFLMNSQSSAMTRHRQSFPDARKLGSLLALLAYIMPCAHISLRLLDLSGRLCDCPLYQRTSFPWPGLSLIHLGALVPIVIINLWP